MNIVCRKMLVSCLSFLAMPWLAFAAMDAKEIYQQNCSVCHASGLAGAPKFKNKEDWEPRLKAKKLQGLVDSAMKGINAMPPKGTCEACQVDDIREAIKYMVPENENAK